MFSSINCDRSIAVAARVGFVLESPDPASLSRDGGIISVRGARTHNLADIDVDIPRGRFVVVSGVSGSGKSSLAFDTLYAEGQRRYVESLSAYARQFLGQMKKADCDGIEGLSPAISIDQKQGSHNPRSTVCTVTEIMDHLRLLWARIGIPHCPECGKEIARRTVQQLVDNILWRHDGKNISLWAPVLRSRKGSHHELMTSLHDSGYVSARINGRESDLSSPPSLERNLRHDIDVRIDRLSVSNRTKQRLTEAVEDGLRLGDGSIIIEAPEEDKQSIQELLSEEFACHDHGSFLPEMSPRVFSFNNPLGACQRCEGLGVVRQFSEFLVTDSSRSLIEGAIRPFSSSASSNWYRSMMQGLAAYYQFPFDQPYGELDEDSCDLILWGSGTTPVPIEVATGSGGQYRTNRPWEGVIPRLDRLLRETTSDRNRQRLMSYMEEQTCIECGGRKLNPSSSGVLVGGINLPHFNDATVTKALEIVSSWLNGPNLLDERSHHIGKEVIKEIQTRLQFLQSVGLGYLSLDRRANTLSGGESQRIRLATQIGSQLTGVMYVLDEPSIGLHQKDNQRLLETLRSLCNLGNTLIVVEHDEETLRQADWIVDIGPGAGKNGGHVVASGPPDYVMSIEDSITGAYLSGRTSIPLPEIRTLPDFKNSIKLCGARHNNLSSIDVVFPLGCMISVTGVSGSGKSSLVTATLAPALRKEIHGIDVIPGRYDRIDGIENIDKVVVIDQSPIGRTPRSNPATYTKAFDEIRNLFSQTQVSKERGWKPGRFSFNVRGGRCEACRGAGQIKLEMNFLPDVWITCEECKGKRYNRETLEATWKGRTIHDILEMSISHAYDFFKPIPKLERILGTLVDVGLSYIHLGQPATTLSGGEAQRVKLSSELKRPAGRHTVYILDEPTTGLSLHDIRQLIGVLHRLRDKGHTIIVIEHHLDVIKSSDWIIDLGPEGGDGGGWLIAEGPPEVISHHATSYTGAVLAPTLDFRKNVSSQD